MPEVARTATIIGRAVDVWGDAWSVRERRSTEHGFDVLLGWPVGQPRGKGAAGGPRVIVTAELAAHMGRIRATPSGHGLPLGNTAITRIRRLLGHHRYIDRAAWWERRAADLIDLTIEQFAERHAVSIGAVVNARHALMGPSLRPAGWWRAPDVSAVLLSDAPTSDTAEVLGISAGSVRRLRWMLLLARPQKGNGPSE